jgi:hypothetical protein
MNNVNALNIMPLYKKSSQDIRYKLLGAVKNFFSRLFCPAYSGLVTMAAKGGLATMAASMRSFSINNFSRIPEMLIWKIITGSRFLVKRKTQ